MSNGNMIFTPQSGPGIGIDLSRDPDQGPFAAGFNERFLAYVIDAAPFLAFHYFSFVALVSGGFFQASSSNEFKLKIVWIMVYVLYETVFTCGGRVTLGKYLLNIRVEGLEGAPLPPRRAFARALAYFISSALVNLGYVMALFTPENRALHDYAAGSRVVSLRERGDIASGLVLALSWGFMTALSGVWINNNILKLTPAEKAQIVAAHRTLSKIGVLEEFYLRRTGHYTNDMRRLVELTGNVAAVKAELLRTLEPDTLVLVSNGRNFTVTAKARNWRKTQVQVKSRFTAPQQ